MAGSGLVSLTFHRVQDASIRTAAKLGMGPTLKIESGGYGFFGDVARALNGIRFAELNRLNCEVSWGTKSLFHSETQGPNAWTSYFSQSAFEFGESHTSFRLPYRPTSHDFLPYDGLDRRLSINFALMRFCAVRPEIQTESDEFWASRLGGGPTLGVHLRLTDVAAGFEGRTCPSLDAYSASVDNWLLSNPDGRVFVATDDERALARLREDFAERIHAREAIRSTDGTSVHGNYDVGVRGDPYLKGRDVLIDALLLARCTRLIRSHSRVTWFSLALAPNNPSKISATDSTTSVECPGCRSKANRVGR